MAENSISANWPELRFASWEATCDTVHMWTQIVGKTKLKLSAPQNHWWHVPLYVTPRGLSTSIIPFGDRAFDVEFDFVAHQLEIRTSAGDRRNIALYPRAVADFYAEYMACLLGLGIAVTIDPKPCEFDDPTPFHEDRHHESYDVEYVARFRRVLVNADRVFRQFRSGFIGKCSPVHFFWGSFDLAVTRFSGRPAPPPEKSDPVMDAAYSHEVISCGFWPGDRRFPNAAFYAYVIPAPPGIADQPIRPQAASWDGQLGEFILRYDALREQDSPDQAILDFCQSTYERAATLAKWDRASLERRS